jgi:hypothetical protein
MNATLFLCKNAQEVSDQVFLKTLIKVRRVLLITFASMSIIILLQLGIRLYLLDSFYSSCHAYIHFSDIDFI